MSNKNRNNYSKYFKEEPQENPTEVVEATSLSNDTPPEEVPQPAPVEKKEKPKNKIGVVQNCVILNVRSEPSITAKVITQLSSLASVTILDAGETEDFYQVELADGVTGFCMKQFIDV